MNWTEGRRKGFILSLLRKGFSRFPAKYETLKKASVGRKTNKATGRLAEHYKCAKCKKEFVKVDVEVDHIVTVVDVDKGFTSYDEYIDRLFCSPDNLQVLCSKCHKEKTKEERERRKACQPARNVKKKRQ